MADRRPGMPGELISALLDCVEAPGPQLRAVALTLLIKAVDPPDPPALYEDLVASDPAGELLDAPAASAARRRLRTALAARLDELAGEHGEATVVRAMRDHLTTYVERWAARAVDDAANRRRAERFLAWVDRPEQLAAARRRGLFAGMDVDEIRRLADDRMTQPVNAELAVGLWEEVEAWRDLVEDRLGDGVRDGPD